MFSVLLGFAALAVFDRFSKYTGITIGLNFVNSAAVGILGLPGFALILMIKWLFAV